MIRHLLKTRLLNAWTCVSSKLHISAAAEGKVEPTCEMAKKGEKQMECDSSKSLDSEGISVKKQSRNPTKEMAGVHAEKVKDFFVSKLPWSKSKGEPVAAPEGSPSKAQLYVASMLLSGVGDAMGYHNGRWEFNYDGTEIHEELEKMGGLESLHLKGREWIVSDDTVMHLATADALVEFGNRKDEQELFKILARKYIECRSDMAGRAPGPTTMQSLQYLDTKNTHELPFNSRGGGCGAAMRAMCIGLRYPRAEELDELIAVSVESGRMTHHAPTGYLGAVASALFTSYAIQKKPILSWGRELVNTVLPKAKEYIRKQGQYVDENLEAWSYFEKKWKKYLKERRIAGEENEPTFERNFGVKSRDEFYKKYSFNGWGGASGHDAPMIAYDALLGSNDSWSELCLRGMLHGGDNDSTGTMAGAWFGALYGLTDVPKDHYKDLEYHDRLQDLGNAIYELAWPKRGTPPKSTPV